MKKGKLLYIGRRLNGDKIANCFLDDKKEECFYTARKWVHIGKWYEVELKKHDGRMAKFMAKSPNQVDGPEQSEADIEKWTNADLAADQEIYRRRVANAFKNKPEMFEDFYKLKKALKSASWSQQKYLMEAFWDYITTEAKK